MFPSRTRQDEGALWHGEVASADPRQSSSAGGIRPTTSVRSDKGDGALAHPTSAEGWSSLSTTTGEEWAAVVAGLANAPAGDQAIVSTFGEQLVGDPILGAELGQRARRDGTWPGNC